MSETPNENIKALFGERLAAFRKVTGLTQEEYGKYVGISSVNINNIENGRYSVGIEAIGRIADSFGVAIHQMANPKFRIPALSRMPKALHDYLAQVKAERLARKQEEGLKITVHLDPILDSDFLRTPKTARMIAEQIEATAKVIIPPGRITAELTKAPRNARVKVVNKPDGEKASGHWYQLVEIG